jgi:ectoine hydroxylase-related dioxygenase (phytanoyl-CoA dioxygenase family)
LRRCVRKLFLTPLAIMYSDQIERDGFAVVENVLDPQSLASLTQNLDHAGIDHLGNQRAGKAFGLRNLMRAAPFTRDLANSASLRSLVEPILGHTARIVRAIYFDKHKDANWKVAWHQDLTIAVREKIEVKGFRAWSTKAGITHVQPPDEVLQNMLTLRIHLDDTGESNGALRVLPGTHRFGRLDASQIEYWKQEQNVVTCAVTRGGILAMRPLLLHSSLPSLNPAHRRVLHFEYAAIPLPGGLEWSNCL